MEFDRVRKMSVESETTGQGKGAGGGLMGFSHPSTEHADDCVLLDLGIV